MPYAATAVSVDQGAMQTILKLIRPLPAQLPTEAICKATIGALGDHWKAMLVYQGRTGHLLYLFDLPKTMEKAGRREHKRYHFRPRENVYVYVQDSSLPGLSAVGQLFDLSSGGLAFRPERAFRIEDGARLKLDTAMFEKGKTFPVIRIDGLPSLEGPLRLRGTVAHVSEKQSIIFVAFVFGLMEPSANETLANVLEARETMKSRGGGGRVRRSAAPAASAPSYNSGNDKAESADTNTWFDDDEFGQLESELNPPPSTILRLARRTCSLLLIKPGGEKSDAIVKSLKDAGFVRLEQCDALDSHIAQTTKNVDALLVALEVGGDPEDTVNAFRSVHELLRTRVGQASVVLSDRFEPVLFQPSEDLSLPIGFVSERQWIEVIDKKLALLR
jgi:hypothetical protein